MTAHLDRPTKVDLPRGMHRCSGSGLVEHGPVAECWECTPKYLTHPAMPFTAYGVELSQIGEDGSWIALGHVDARRMVAAMRKVGRSLYGRGARSASEDTFGSFSDVADLFEIPERKRATFVEHPECGWWCDGSAEAQAHPRAVAVTMWWV